MKNRSVFQLLAIAFAICLATLGFSAPAAAPVRMFVERAHICRILEGGLYNFQMDEWNSP